jgi:predicted RND superfamily exporter protein
MIADDLITFVRNDIIVFGIGVFLFMVMTLWFIFRDIKWVVFPLLSCLVSAIVMIGMLGFLNWKVTVFSSNFLSLMLVLTMEINIHYLERYRGLQKEFPKKNQTFVTNLTTNKIFKPILYGVLTTVLGFLSFIFCDIQPIIDFGWMMSVGLVISMVISIFLLPYLIIKFKPKVYLNKEIHHFRVTEVLAKIAIERRYLILISSFIILLLSVYGMSKLKVENSFINYFGQKTEIYKGLKLIDEKLGGTTPLEIIVKFKDTSLSKSV